MFLPQLFGLPSCQRSKDTASSKEVYMQGWVLDHNITSPSSHILLLRQRWKGNIVHRAVCGAQGRVVCWIRWSAHVQCIKPFVILSVYQWCCWQGTLMPSIHSQPLWTSHPPILPSHNFASSSASMSKFSSGFSWRMARHDHTTAIWMDFRDGRTAAVDCLRYTGHST